MNKNIAFIVNFNSFSTTPPPPKKKNKKKKKQKKKIEGEKNFFLK